jgi:hypothetical protein
MANGHNKYVAQVKVCKPSIKLREKRGHVNHVTATEVRKPDKGSSWHIIPMSHGRVKMGKR